jgi:GH25 family lysozyme M1 (1,4-beta-N-acetylmuramidase)
MSVVCPAGATIEGIDVSHANGTVDWAMVKSAGIEFAYTKLAENVTPDPSFTTNWSAMQTAGVVRGAYQYFHPGDDPTAQASYVVTTLGTLAAADLPVAVIVEANDNQTPATIAANLATFVAGVATGTGKQPVIYVGKSFWEADVQSSAFGAEPLWIAAAGVVCPNLPTGWTSWVMWQDSISATVAGIAGTVDHDQFNGSAADLAAFAAMTVTVDGAIDAAPVVDAAPVDAGPRDAPESIDASGHPETGRGGGCCDAGHDTSGSLLLALGIGATLARRRSASRAT